MHVPFFLDDNTARVLIDPRGAELDLHRDFHQEFCDSFFSMKQEAPPNVHLFLSRHGIVTQNKIRVEEFCIKPKNALFVLGTLGNNPGIELTSQAIQNDEHHTLASGNNLVLNPLRAVLDGSIGSLAGLGGADASPDDSAMPEPVTARSVAPITVAASTVDAATTRVINLSPDSGPKKIEDMTQQQKIAAALSKAGITNPAAWSVAGVMPAVPTESIHSSNGTVSTDGFDPRPPVVLMRGKNNSSFLISWRSQRDLARSLGWKCALMIWGGPALALAALYGLLYLTHLL
jgi:hypothetical protein